MGIDDVGSNNARGGGGEMAEAVTDAVSIGAVDGG